jgi:hypothetical protein
MKKYIQPKIKSIELDSKQTILQACKISAVGIYFYAGTFCRYALTGGPTPGTIFCDTGVKDDNTQFGAGFLSTTENQPS